MVEQIKAARTGRNRLPEHDCNLNLQFLKGAQRLKTHRTLTILTWDLGLVLATLQQAL